MVTYLDQVTGARVFFKHDLVGLKFGRLTVLSFHHRSVSSNNYWVCKCDCGNVVTRVLRGQATTRDYSCGCSRSDISKNIHLKKSALVLVDKYTGSLCPIYHDLRGKKSGRLLIIDFQGKSASRGNLWLGLCDCGNKHVIAQGDFLSGDIQSCGCLQKDYLEQTIPAWSITHGESYHIAYHRWSAMMNHSRNGKAPVEGYLQDMGRYAQFIETLPNYRELLANPGAYRVVRIDKTSGWVRQNIAIVEKKKPVYVDPETLGNRRFLKERRSAYLGDR